MRENYSVQKVLEECGKYQSGERRTFGDKEFRNIVQRSKDNAKFTRFKLENGAVMPDIYDDCEPTEKKIVLTHKSALRFTDKLNNETQLKMVNERLTAMEQFVNDHI